MDQQALFKSVQSKSVLNMDGDEVILSSLWLDRQVVLVFLRHFG